jgi:hypothetical protein
MNMSQHFGGLAMHPDRGLQEEKGLDHVIHIAAPSGLWEVMSVTKYSLSRYARETQI